MVYEMIQKTGMQHIQEQLECEDVIYHKETPEFYCFGIADGKSGRKYCREGGKSSLEVVEAYITEKGIEYICREKEKIKYEIDRRIKARLFELSKNFQSSLNEFASTIMLFIVDLKKKQYLSIHLGDGTMIGVRDNGKPEMISPPENGITAYHTWLTSDEASESHIYITSGNLEHYKRIFLVSDGATSVYIGKRLTLRFRKMLSKAEGIQTFAEYFKKENLSDDASYIILEL